MFTKEKNRLNKEQVLVSEILLQQTKLKPFSHCSSEVPGNLNAVSHRAPEPKRITEELA